MKKLVIVLSLGILLQLISFSCKKESSNESIKNSKPQLSEQNFNQSITYFMDGMESIKQGKILKDYAKISIDSALMYIDATLNYKYCFHSHRYGDLKAITVNIDIPVISVEGRVMLVDAFQACINAEDALKDEYINLAVINKKLVGIMLNNPDIDFENERITLQLTGLVGINSPIINSNEEEYWYVRDSESCDHTIQNIGAPNIIENQINYDLIQQPQANRRIIRTNLSLKTWNDPTVFVNPCEGDVIDNLCDYCIYYATSYIVNPSIPIIPDETKCLGNADLCDYNLSNELDYYVQSIEGLIIWQLSIFNQTFQSVFIDDNSNTINNVLVIKHIVNLYYGNQYNIEERADFPINIDNI